MPSEDKNKEDRPVERKGTSGPSAQQQGAECREPRNLRNATAWCATYTL